MVFVAAFGLAVASAAWIGLALLAAAAVRAAIARVTRGKA